MREKRNMKIEIELTQNQFERIKALYNIDVSNNSFVQLLPDYISKAIDDKILEDEKQARNKDYKILCQISKKFNKDCLTCTKFDDKEIKKEACLKSQLLALTYQAEKDGISPDCIT